jgi:hypothetical protein
MNKLTVQNANYLVDNCFIPSCDGKIITTFVTDSVIEEAYFISCNKCDFDHCCLNKKTFEAWKYKIQILNVWKKLSIETQINEKMRTPLYQLKDGFNSQSDQDPISPHQQEKENDPK